MIDTFFKKFNVAGPAVHVLGSVPIYGMWSTSNIAPSSMSLFPHKFGAGDHRVFLVDFEFD